MSSTGEWNIQRLNQNFVQYDHEGILRIPTGIGDVEDRRVWRYDKSGVFTVKSGYWVGRKLDANNDQSSTSEMIDWWKLLWNLEIPLKIKIFIWKVCYDWIPTRGNLKRRGMVCDDTCQECGLEEESTIHALWECPNLRSACDWWLPSGKYCYVKFRNAFDMLCFYSKRLLKGELELFCIIIWKVWCSRNDRIHNGKRFDLNDDVWWSKNYIEEFRRVRCNKEREATTNGGLGKLDDERWRPQNHGVLKINCDGRVDKRRRRVGFGIVVRDAGGSVMRCWAQGSEATYDLECVKAMAIYKAVLVGRQMGLVNFVVESDAKIAIKQIINRSILDNNHGGILESIQSIVSVDENVDVRAVSSKANKVAGELANEALKIKEVAVWMEDVPLCIRKLVEDEHGS